jgi:hypothetical protein
MNKLLLLDDVPAGRGEPASVAFNHALYAELLRDVLLDNRSGICVGFFSRSRRKEKPCVVNLTTFTARRTAIIIPEVVLSTGVVRRWWPKRDDFGAQRGPVRPQREPFVPKPFTRAHTVVHRAQFNGC